MPSTASTVPSAPSTNDQIATAGETTKQEKKTKSTGKRSSRGFEKEEPRKKAKVRASSATASSKKKTTAKQQLPAPQEPVQQPPQQEEAKEKATEKVVAYQAMVAHTEKDRDGLSGWDEYLRIFNNKSDCADFVRNRIGSYYGFTYVKKYKVTEMPNGFVSVFASGWRRQTMTVFMREVDPSAKQQPSKDASALRLLIPAKPKIPSLHARAQMKA